MTTSSSAPRKTSAKRSRRASAPQSERTESSNTAVATPTPASHLLHEIPLDQVDAHPGNPRKDLGDLSELSASIAEQGVLEPVLVVPVPGSGKFPSRFRTIAGHRRCAAAREAGLATVPAIIREGMTEAEQVEVMLVENLHRSDLTAFEEAHGMRALFDFGMKRTAIAKRTGRNVKTVSQRLSIATLPPAAESLVNSRMITLEDAIELADLRAADKEVYDGLEAELEAGALQGWAIRKAAHAVAARQANKAWIKSLDQAGIARGELDLVDPPQGARTIESLQIGEGEHMSCPGTLVLHYPVDREYDIEEYASWYCTAPDEHHPDEVAALIARQATGQEGLSHKELVAQRQAASAPYAAAWEARWSWICHLLADTSPEREPARHSLIDVAVNHIENSAFLQLQPMSPPAGVAHPTDRLARLALPILGNRDHSLLPRTAWQEENAVDPDHWTFSVDTMRDVVAWLDILTAAGYTLTNVEVQSRDARLAALADEAGEVA